MGRTNMRNNSCDRLNVVGTHFQRVSKLLHFWDGSESHPYRRLQFANAKIEHDGAHRAAASMITVCLCRRLGRRRSLIARSEMCNSTLGGEINSEAA